MDNHLDTVLVELVVTACEMGPDRIWMQGDIEIRLNGEKPCADSDIVDLKELLKSADTDGEFAIFSCCCGIPECSGWVKGIEVLHSGESTRWTNLNNGKTWCFDRRKISSDLNEIREEAAIFRNFFIQKDMDYTGALVML